MSDGLGGFGWISFRAASIFSGPASACDLLGYSYAHVVSEKSPS